MMYSHEDKVRLLQKYAPSILREHEGSEFYVGAAIPPDIKEAVIESFLYSLDEQEILGVCKLAQLGSGGMGGMWGYFFTDTQACEYVGAEVSGSVVSYAEIKSMEITKGYRTDYARDLVFHMYDGSVVTWSCAYLNKTPLFEFFREMKKKCEKDSSAGCSSYGTFSGFVDTLFQMGRSYTESSNRYAQSAKNAFGTKEKLPGGSYENKVKIMQKYASAIARDRLRFYTGTEIPKEQMKNVLKCFPLGLDQRTIIGVYEIAKMSGGGAWGYCFTESRAYEYGGDMVLGKPIRYAEIKGMELTKHGVEFQMYYGAVITWSCSYMNQTPLYNFFREMMKLVQKGDRSRAKASSNSAQQKKPDAVPKQKDLKQKRTKPAAADRWNEMKESLRRKADTDVFEQYIKDMELQFENERDRKLQVRLANQEAAYYVKQNWDAFLKEEAKRIYGGEVEIAYGYVETIHTEAPDTSEEQHKKQEDDLAGISHIISKNPVLKEEAAVKKAYFETLEKYVRLGGWEDGEYVKAQMNLYSHLFLSEETCRQSGGKPDMDAYRYFILLDICHILGFEKNLLTSDSMKKVTDKMISDFPRIGRERNIYSLILDAAGESYGNWDRLEKMAVLQTYREYIKAVKQNLKFWHTNPFRILVTATMSAGKSTFINCLAGKDVSLSQTMACTGRIHRIIGKAFEDGFSCKYDEGFNLMARKEEILHPDSFGAGPITVSTCYNGFLGGERIEIYDSPGVNYSEDPEHKRVTEEFIRGKNYDLLVYLMNATQLGTDDEAAHLNFVKSCIGDLPVLFVINKIDCINGEEEDIRKIIQNQIRFLNEKGFSNPLVAPASALAGYLAKCSQYGELSKMKTREFNAFYDKFEEMGLTDCYKRYYPGIQLYYPEQEAAKLLKNCGMAYVEKIIKTWCEERRITEIQGLDALG